MTAAFGANAALSGRRGSRRVCLDLPGSAEFVTGRQQVRVTSLSATGAAIEFTTEPPKLGADVILHFERWECFGRIVWGRGARAGISFYDPLTEADVIEARRASDTRDLREASRLASIARAWAEGRNLRQR